MYVPQEASGRALEHQFCVQNTDYLVLADVLYGTLDGSLGSVAAGRRPGSDMIYVECHGKKKKKKKKRRMGRSPFYKKKMTEGHPSPGGIKEEKECLSAEPSSSCSSGGPRFRIGGSVLCGLCKRLLIHAFQPKSYKLLSRVPHRTIAQPQLSAPRAAQLSIN